MSAEVKQCLWCGDDFKQSKPPKAEQVYCKWICYVEATQGGFLL